MYNETQNILNKEIDKNTKNKWFMFIYNFLNINKRNIINAVFIIIIFFLLTEVSHLKQQLKNNIIERNTLKKVIKKSEEDIKIEERKFNDFLIGRTNIYTSFQQILESEQYMPQLKTINKNRSFDQKLPLPKEINCKPHLIL